MLCLLTPRVKVASVANSMCLLYTYIHTTVFMGLAKRAHLYSHSVSIIVSFIHHHLNAHGRQFQKDIQHFLVVSLPLRLASVQQQPACFSANYRTRITSIY